VRIAFLGLEHMGLPMAKNLLGLGHVVTVYNRTASKAKGLTAFGVKEATSVADTVKNAEVVITMLSDDDALKKMVHGPGGLIQNLPPMGIHLCMGTIDVETSAMLASAHAQAGQGYVAALVFGRADAAESRHIWIVVGGMEPQVNRCRPIFEALGQGYTRIGPHAAQAHALKLGANMLTAAMELAVSEILSFAKKAGLPPADYLRLLNSAIFRSHMVGSYRGGGGRPSFDPEDKTLDLAAGEMLLESAKDLGELIPVADLLNARLQAATARGWGENDLSELTETCRRETELEGSAAPVPGSDAVFDDVFAAVFDAAPDPVPVPAPHPVPVPAPVPVPVPEPAAQKPNPSVSKTSRRSLREPKKATDSKGTKPREEQKPQSMPPPMDDKAPTTPDLDKAAGPAGPPNSSRMVPSNAFPAMDGETQIALDLNQTSHFEVIKGRVWAWSQGKRYETHWNSLSDVELAFNHILFLLIKRHVLLRPDAVLDIRSKFGGGAKARVSDDLELDVSRAAAPRLKVLLGI